MIRVKSFFVWLTFYLVVWGASIFPLFEDLDQHIWRLLGVAFFFSLFFITPLFKENRQYLTISFCLQIGIVAFIFFPIETYNVNQFVLFIFVLLMAEATERLPVKQMVIVHLLSFLAIMVTFIFGSVSLMTFLFNIFFIIIVLAGFIFYKSRYVRYQYLLSQYEKLSSEFRTLKRRTVRDEESARQEERHMIGQEIHDSVGHKLTSLIMQLEAYRIQLETKDSPHVDRLKKLADESLEETRRAVKTYKQKEVGGLQGVMRLIRKLELESFIRVHFSVNHGAFAAPLTGEQSFTIYRAVQEGLTNMMKHSKTREAQITFDAPGGSIFRFEMTNPVKHTHNIKEGYGLISMRERLEKLGGGLETQRHEKQFILRGWVRLKERGDRHDSSTSS